jgi:4-amino-4-deoxy-L-arabinose transferase-like glycosyltransferase
LDVERERTAIFLKKRADVAAIALIVLSLVRMMATFTIYSATVDEPMHLSAALQLYTVHDYSYQPENPPLPRVIFGLAPWLGGMKFDPAIKMEEQLQRVFYSNDRYRTNLVLARVGTLVFFTLAALATWWWGRRELGATGGLVTAALFTLQPIIVGYSGLATHDGAATAGVAVALLAFLRWLDVPSTRRAMVFGAAFAIAILCKFSCVGYVPVACLAMYLVRCVRDANVRAAWRRIVPSFFAALIPCLVMIWAGYAFTMDRVEMLEGVRDILGNGAVARFVTQHPKWPLPAPMFWMGVGGLIRFDRLDFYGVLFGEIKARGWWYYFPIAVALKSTLASLVLALGALFVRRMRAAGEALAAALAILALSMTSHLDLGVRYVLPMYVPLSVAGAAAALAMFERRRLRIAAFALVAWHVVASLTAIPDAFPYFNEAAGRRPWLYLVDSNVDWGQDILRLKRVLREKKIDRIGIAAMGWNDWDALRFPPHYELQRDAPSQGWAAVSEHLYWVVGYRWLHGRPYERVGKSIRLYYIP